MRRIVVPTDFSKNADNALNYAIEFANLFEAEIHLVHTYHVSNRADMFISINDIIREDAEKVINNLAKETQRRLDKQDGVFTHIVSDYPAEGIAYIAKKNNADMIIMGTKGAGALKGAIWGSVASRLITITKVPVIAIPENYTHFKLEHIVLAVDNLKFDNKNIMSLILNISNRAMAKITTFKMVNSLEPAHAQQFSDSILELSNEYFISQNNDLKKSLIGYVATHSTDLVCMIRKERGFFIDLMHNSATKKIIFDCPVPLMIFNEIDS